MASRRKRLPRDLPGLAARIRRCRWCGLNKGRERAVPGEGPSTAQVFLVGEGPGRAEDREGRPFCGAAGKVLDDALAKAGLPRDRTFVTNAVKCRPPGNRRPRASEVAACRPYLLAQIAAVRPRVIVAMGQTALRATAGPGTTLAAARGTWTDWEGTPVLATYHPAAVLYDRRLFRTLVKDLRTARRRGEGR